MTATAPKTERTAPPIARRSRLQRFAKRTLDLGLTVPAFVVLSPVFAVTAAAVVLSCGRPVFFTQPRVGFRGEIFEIRKFRTMTDQRDAHGEPLPDADRLTKTGSLLRRWSLDELPELFQVISGQLSLVGPRPFMAEYRDHYSSEQWARHGVPPGITGLAQVSGRNQLTWNERIDIDLEYIQTWSLSSDMRILMQTISQTVRGIGVNAEGESTMSKWVPEDSVESDDASASLDA